MCGGGSNLNFFKGTGDTSVVFSGSFDSTVIKTDSPLNNGTFDEVVIDVAASNFSGVTAMFTTLISGTFKSAGKFALARIGLVGDITMDVDEEMGGAPFVENRSGFITSAGVDWVSIAEKATGEGDMEGWSLDMQEIMRANVEAGDLPRFNNFCVSPAADVIDCDTCNTLLDAIDEDPTNQHLVEEWEEHHTTCGGYTTHSVVEYVEYVDGVYNVIGEVSNLKVNWDDLHQGTLSAANQ